ncbi:LOW QUALITY PROTEIN: ATP-binding cassette sub-family A member 13 [Rhynchonycteris naso]
MRPAGCQLRALLWKNWLCRRTPVHSLAEFLWPCVLFTILMVLRLQEPPRHRDNCYLQPRDLPSGGVLPFVQGLLCNSGGARCRNASNEATEHHFRTFSGPPLCVPKWTMVWKPLNLFHPTVTLASLEVVKPLLVGDVENGIWSAASHSETVWAESSPSPKSVSPFLRGWGTVGDDDAAVHTCAVREQPSGCDGKQPDQAAASCLLALEHPFSVLRVTSLSQNVAPLAANTDLCLPLCPHLRSMNNPDLTDSHRDTIDLNKTEEVISTLEDLHRPQIDFPLLLPRLIANNVPPGEGVRAGADFLQVVWREDQKEVSLMRESGCSLSLHSVVWDPRKVWADLKSRFGFDDLRAEQVLNFSAELKECRQEALAPQRLRRRGKRRAEAGLFSGRHRGAQGPSEAMVLSGGRQGSLFQKVLSGDRPQPAGAQRSAASGEPVSGGRPEALHAGLLLLNGSVAADDGPSSGHPSPETVLNFTNEPLMMGKKLHITLEDGPMNFLWCFVEFLEKLLLPSPSSDSSRGSTETFLNTSHLWVKHLQGLEREPHGIDTQKLSEFGKEMIEKIQTLIKKESSLKILDFSALEYEKILSKSFNFSQLFRSDWPQSSVVKTDFVHLSEPVINSLYELGFLRHEQVSETLGTVYAVRNTSDLFSALSDPHKEVGKILTRLYLNVFKDKDSAFLLQVYSSFYLYVYKFLGIPSSESWLAFLTQTSKRISDNEFNFQNISKAYAFLYEITELLGGMAAVSSCQLLSIFNFLGLRAKGLGLEVVYATLTGFKQLLTVKEDFRVFRDVNGLFNSPAGAPLGDEFFALDNGSISSMNDPAEAGFPHTLPWAQVLSNLSSNNSGFNESTAVHCAASWLRVWTEIGGSRMAQTLNGLARDEVNLEMVTTGLRETILFLRNVSHDHVWLSCTDIFQNITKAALEGGSLHVNTESGCSSNKSDISCVGIFLKNVTDFLNVILTAVFEKEKVAKFEILLTLLNDSTDQVRMIINNLRRDFEFASQSNWVRFTELILRPVEMSDGIPSDVQNHQLHLVALGRDIQNLTKDIFPDILENNFPSGARSFLNMFASSPEKKAINRLGNSFFHLASYLALNLSHDLQHSFQIIPHEIIQAVGLGIRLMRGVFNSVMPAVHPNTPEDPSNNQVLKKVTSLPLTLKNKYIDLLVDQLGETGENLMDFLKNISILGTDDLGVTLLAGLMDKSVDCSHAWHANQLLTLSRLLPREDVNPMVDAYNALPHAGRLLHRVVDRNITEALRDVYDFTVLHSRCISSVTREDFTGVIKTLLDIVELISETPSVLAEAWACLPLVWCWNHSSPGFQQNPESEACNSHFYSKVASLLDHLHLSPPGEVSQCSNKSLRMMEITKKVVCIIHELVDWNSILLELFEVFHVKTSLVKNVQEFWHKVLPLVLSSGSQSHSSISGLCPSGSMKQVALQVMEKWKNVNFTEVTPEENILETLVSLNKILNYEGTETSLRNVALDLDRVVKALSGDQSRENSPHSLVSLFVTFLKTNLTGRCFEAPSSFIKSETASNSEEPWLESEQTKKDLNQSFLINSIHDLAGRPQEAARNLSDTDLPILNFVNLTLNQTKPGKARVSADWATAVAVRISSFLSPALPHAQLKETYSSPQPLDRDGLRGNLSRALGHLGSSLEHAAEDCACPSVLDWTLRRLHTYVLWVGPKTREVFVFREFDDDVSEQFHSNCGPRPPRLLAVLPARPPALPAADAGPRWSEKKRDGRSEPKAVLVRGHGHSHRTAFACVRRTRVGADSYALSLLSGVPPEAGARIPARRVLPSVLAVALSGRCDQETLRLLPAFPEGEKSRAAVEELCGLPGTAVYSLLVSTGRNLGLAAHAPDHSGLLPVDALTLLVLSGWCTLRPSPWDSHKGSAGVVTGRRPRGQEALVPVEAGGVLRSVLDLVSGLSRLLPRARRVLDRLPQILPSLNVPALGDLLDFRQDPHGDQAGRSASGSLQSVMKMLCKEQATFLSNSNVVLNLPSVGGLVDRRKKNSTFPKTQNTPFCLKLYQEILHSPNCALVWSFLKPILHGKILYTPNTPEINEVSSSTAPQGAGAPGRTCPPLPLHVTYTTRTSVLHSMRTDVGRNPLWKFHPQSLPADGFKYNHVFVPLRDMMERAIVLQAGREAAGPAVQVQEMPCRCHSSDLSGHQGAVPPVSQAHGSSPVRLSLAVPCGVYRRHDRVCQALAVTQLQAEPPHWHSHAATLSPDRFLNNVGFFFPLIMMRTWMVSVAGMVRTLVYEQESRIAEYLRMMGVPPVTHFLAWILENAAVMTISSAALAAALKTSGILAHSDGLLVFLFLLDFRVSVIMLSYPLSVLFSRAHMAALCASFLPYVVLLVLHRRLGAAVQALLCLLSATAFGQGVLFITFLERQEAGVQWDNVDQSLEHMGLTFGWVSWMILLDSGLYFLCGWYLSNLIPAVWASLYFPGLGSARALDRSVPVQFLPGPLGGLFASAYSPSIAAQGLGLPGLFPHAKPTHTVSSRVRARSPESPHRKQLWMVGSRKPWHLPLTASYGKGVCGLVAGGQRTQRPGLLLLRQNLDRAGRTGPVALLGFGGPVLKLSLSRDTGWTIIFTTHHLDKGEALSDCVAVLRGGGRLRCCGQPLSLTGAHGQGLSLKLTKQPSTPEADGLQDAARATSLIQTFIPRAFLGGASGREPSYAIPKDADRAGFKGLFQALEQNQRPLHLTGCRVSDATWLVFPRREAGLAVPGARRTGRLRAAMARSRAANGRAPHGLGRSRDPGGVVLLIDLEFWLVSRTSHCREAGRLPARRLLRLYPHVVAAGFARGTLARPRGGVSAGADSTPALWVCECRSDHPLPTTVISNKSPGGRAGSRGVEEADLQKALRCRHFPSKGAEPTQAQPVQCSHGAPGPLRPGGAGVPAAWVSLTAPPVSLSHGNGSSEGDDMHLAHLLLRKFGDGELPCANLTPGQYVPAAPCEEEFFLLHTDPCPHPDVWGSCGCLTCPNASAGAPYLTNRLGHTLLNPSAFHLEGYLLLPSEKPRLGGWSFGVRVPGPVQGARSSLQNGCGRRRLTRERLCLGRPHRAVFLLLVCYNQKAFHALPSYLNHLNNLILGRLLPPAADWRQYDVWTLQGDGRASVLPRARRYASLPWTYLVSRVFPSADVAFISYVSLRFLFGLCTVLMTSMPRLLAVTSGAQNIYHVLKWVFTIFPQFCLGQGLIELCYKQIRHDLTQHVSIDSYASPFEMDFLGWDFVQGSSLLPAFGHQLRIGSQSRTAAAYLSGWVAVGSPCLPAFLDSAVGLYSLCPRSQRGHVLSAPRDASGPAHVYPLRRRPPPQPAPLFIYVDLLLMLLKVTGRGTVTACKDTDVAKERTRVLKGRTGGDIILVSCNLSKNHRGFSRRTAAVQDVSLGVRRGESCHPEPARTLHVPILQPDESTPSPSPTAPSWPCTADQPGRGATVRQPGSGRLLSASRLWVPTGVHAGSLGSRPGAPAITALSLRHGELLLPTENPCLHILVIPVAGDLVRRLHLEAHVDQPVATYSGGTKRELSTALALLGEPDLLWLDEPSSGMDPCSKRFLWKAVTKEVAEGCAVVLTSHSTEDCWAVCTRLASLVSGSFRCLGSPQHIKNRFGDGYTGKGIAFTPGTWSDLQHLRPQPTEPRPGPRPAFCALTFEEHRFQFSGIPGQCLHLLEYHVPKRWGCLADLFRVLENRKTALDIRRYSIAQATLEQAACLAGVTRRQVTSGGHHFCSRTPVGFYTNADKDDEHGEACGPLKVPKRQGSSS